MAASVKVRVLPLVSLTLSSSPVTGVDRVGQAVLGREREDAAEVEGVGRVVGQAARRP